MKREIKFRGFCTTCKEKIEGDLIHGVGSKSGKFFILPIKANLAGVQHCHPLDGVEVFTDSIGQFTGLQDINGKDIYEGDIVNICGGFGYFKNMEGVNATYIVSFKTCEYLLFRHDIKLTWGRLSRLEEMNYNCEIIGNIYENPELLKTTENE